MANDDLHPLLEDIQRKITNVREDLRTIVGKIEGVQETIQEGVDRILEAINDNIQAQAELKMMDKVASVRSIPAHIEAEREQVAAEKEELEAKLQSIGQRYEKRHQDLEATATERIRDLGSHVFEIQEDEYEDNVEDPFHEHVSETWQEMQLDNAEIGRERIERLDTELERTHESVDELLERREQFLADIREIRADTTPSSDTPRRVQIPFWTVTVEREGEREQLVYGPADLDKRDDEWYRVGFDDRDAFGPLIEGVAETPMPDSAAATGLARETVEGVLGQHVSADVAGQTDFADAVGDAVGDGVQITVEGRDDS